MADKFHCLECAGLAKAKGERCAYCDGEGNELPQKKPVESSKPYKKKK